MVEVQSKTVSSGVTSASCRVPLKSELQLQTIEKPSIEPQLLTNFPKECPNCKRKNCRMESGGMMIIAYGSRKTGEGIQLQRYLCKNCTTRFSEPNPYKLSRTTIGTSQLCALQEAKKLVNPQQEKVVEINAKTPNQGSIVDFLWHLKKQGYSDATIATRVKVLKFMNKQGVNLLDPEAVKLFIAKQKTWCNGHKQIVVHAYDGFAKMLSIKWDAPYYQNDKSLPTVPYEKDIDVLISGCSTKIATSLLLFKETGMRVGEAWKLKWFDLDDENNTIKCKAEKHGNPRQFKISPRLVAMLQKLPKKNEYIFSNTSLSAHRWRFDQQKRKLSVKLQNPRLLQIKFHSLRHYYATKLYDQTKSLLIVQEKLGHRNINSTMVYTHLVEFDEESQNYYHATAKDEKEAGELIDKGFSYVCTTPQGIMMFRKRK